MNPTFLSTVKFRLMMHWAHLISRVSRKLYPAHMTLFQDIMRNSLHPHVIGACIKLNIPDLLEHESLTLEDLTDKTGADPEYLQRLLRAMQFFDIVKETDKNRYGLSRTGTILTSQNPMRNTLRLMSAEWPGEFAQLTAMAQIGKKTFHTRFENDIFAHFKKDRELADCFNKAMAESEASILPLILARYDFSPYEHIVDIGGGKGRFLTMILQKHHAIKGIIFDNENMLASRDIQDFRDRCQVITGNFFEKIPDGGDLYILKNILHDWSDESVVDILKNIRQAVNVGTKLLIITLVMPERGLNVDLIYMDLLMMTVFGGKERTFKQFKNLLTETGFRFKRCEKIIGQNYLIEAEAF